MARHSVFVASRAALVEMFGADGLKEVGRRIPDEIRKAVVDTGIVGDDWMPERWVLQWQEAVWAGPAQKRDDVFDEFCRRTVAQGFGRVRKMLLSLLTPAQMFPRAAEMWRCEHTHGSLTAEVDAAKRSALLTLSDHPYATSPLAARVLSESLRHAASLARTKGVDETHALKGGVLTVRLEWR